MNMDIWVVGTVNPLFIRHSYTEIKVVIDETQFFVIGPFCNSRMY